MSIFRALLTLSALGMTTACDRTPGDKPFAFADAAITLPDDRSTLPPGPQVDVAVANCTSCHSPAMITTQPALTTDQWAATVRKMRDVYKAPIADADVGAIETYLNDLSARQRAAALASARGSP